MTVHHVTPTGSSAYLFAAESLAWVRLPRALHPPRGADPRTLALVAHGRPAWAEVPPWLDETAVVALGRVPPWGLRKA